MLFSAQRFLEDLFRASGVRDPDQYAVALANLYFSRRGGSSKKEFLAAMRRAKTAFFRVNGIERGPFEQRTLAALDRRFKKKIENSALADIQERLAPAIQKETRVLRRSGRKTMRVLLDAFRRGVEALGIDMFWRSRATGALKPQPESIARDSLAVMLHGVLEGKGITLKEFATGTGWVDVGVVRASGLQIVELKVLRGGRLKGAGQLGRYLSTHGLNEGWLVVVDARRPANKSPLPDRVELKHGRIANVVVIDINPPPPSDEE
jgi:hypothetical protein